MFWFVVWFSLLSRGFGCFLGGCFLGWGLFVFVFLWLLFFIMLWVSCLVVVVCFGGGGVKEEGGGGSKFEEQTDRKTRLRPNLNY